MTDFSVIDKKTGEQVKITLDKGIDDAVTQIFKALAPRRSEALKAQIQKVPIEDGFQVISTIYYMPYTTEKWGYHRGWRKILPNPNERWWAEAFETAMRFLSSVYGKEFRRES